MNRRATNLAFAAWLGICGAAAADDVPLVTHASGEKNWIATDGAQRSGATFTFREVAIDGNGWLVIHQIVDGTPVGSKYLGASYIKSGVSRNVRVTVDYSPSPGESFVVMLHRDVNENQIFDFVFVDPPHVLDKAVFEGEKMVAYTFAAP